MLFLALALTAGCAVGDDEPSTVTTSSTRPGGRPAVVEPAEPGETGANAPTTTVAGAVTTLAGDEPTTTTTQRVALTRAGATGDREGDHGLGGAPYADIRAVEIDAAGDRLVVRVSFAAEIPAGLPEGEVAGVGVDLFTTNPPRQQSDWQVFADGSPDGWFGYLDGPDGPVTLPGTLTIRGSALVFDLRWTDVDDPAAGSFSAFADWVRDGTPLNTVTEDHAPDAGTADFRRP